MEQGKETVREATVGKVQDMASNVVDSARETASHVVDTARDAAGSVVQGAERAIDSASTTARDAGSTLLETIQRNPVPSALIGMSLGWLWLNMRRSDGQSYRSDYSPRFGDYSMSPRDAAYGRSSGASGLGETLGQVKEQAGEAISQAKERAGAAADQVQQRASEMGQSLQYQAAQTTDTVQRWMYQNPLAAGAVALALGAAAGMAVPETAPEQRWLGEARDRLVDKAQQAAQEVGQKVQAVAQEAIGAAQDQARSQGLTA